MTNAVYSNVSRVWYMEMHSGSQWHHYLVCLLLEVKGSHWLRESAALFFSRVSLLRVPLGPALLFLQPWSHRVRHHTRHLHGRRPCGSIPISYQRVSYGVSLPRVTLGQLIGTPGKRAFFGDDIMLFVSPFQLAVPLLFQQSCQPSQGRSACYSLFQRHFGELTPEGRWLVQVCPFPAY